MFSSVPFSHSVVSDSLRPHGLQLPQASLSFTISHSLLKLMSIESVMPSNHLILCSSRLLLPQSFPASGSFPVSWLFTSGDQNIGALALGSVLPVNTQGWFPLRLTALISMLSKGLSRVFFRTTIRKVSSSVPSLLYGPTLNPYMSPGESIAFQIWIQIWIFARKVMSLLF